MIQFDRVSFCYANQSRPALLDIDWCVPAGAIAVVTGPSGSGKSTLARCVNGLIPHFHGGSFGGRVVVAGEDTRSRSTASLSRRVGFVAQVPESQTITDRVEDEIAFGPQNLGLSRQALRLGVEETIDLLGLNHLRHRMLGTLSGGERQRVVIAAAMAMRPDVLVLDEPTSQLDPTSVDEILSSLRRLNDELATTILLVEHRLDRVLGMADQLLVLDRSGRIEIGGPARRVVCQIPGPPLVQAARMLRWQPTPVTVREARQFARHHTIGPREGKTNRTARTNRHPVVGFERVSFGYDRQSVLDQVSTTFEAGSLTAIMGRNGSGKTSLLKLVNGLARPVSGRVVVEGDDITGRSTTDLARAIAYLPQNAGTLLFNDSVEAELRFTLRQRRVEDDIPAMLARLELTGLAKRNPLDLSGGERLRAALAAILIGRPRILLLDEPTRGLDSTMKAMLGKLLRQRADDGVAVILATHDVDMVAEIADRVIILGDGEIVADGSPHEVMPGSFAFSTQINRVFGGRVLTLGDVRRRHEATDS